MKAFLINVNKNLLAVNYFVAPRQILKETDVVPPKQVRRGREAENEARGRERGDTAQQVAIHW